MRCAGNIMTRDELMAKLGRVWDERQDCGDSIRYDELTQQIDDLLDRLWATRSAPGER